MNRFLAVLSISYSILKAIGSLLGAWLSLGWKVRKTRKSFEAELVKEGISKKDAKKLSECYSTLKDQMMSVAKYPFRTRRKD